MLQTKSLKPVFEICDLTRSFMAELKTKVNDASVSDFLESIANEQTRNDCQTIVQIMQQATNSSAKMWGTNIIGFGTYHYQYASGREADWMQIGFSPRKQNMVLYIGSGFEEYEKLLAQLGKHSCGKSCLYIKKLSDIDLPTLEKLIQDSIKHMLEKYPEP
jgi:hypothetical protein